MAKEIERKFLVKGDFKPEAFKATRITQGYLSSVPERTVRVRVKGDKGFITIKGIGNASGASRYEWEKEIPVEEVKELLLICEPGVIDKTFLSRKSRNCCSSASPVSSTRRVIWSRPVNTRSRSMSSTATTRVSSSPRWNCPTRTPPLSAPHGWVRRSPATPATTIPCSCSRLGNNSRQQLKKFFMQGAAAARRVPPFFQSNRKRPNGRGAEHAAGL